jgi:uncharacterized membrane protein
VRHALRIILAVMMVSVGAYHFIAPQPFVKIVPAFLPEPLLLVYISGVFEILGGIGLLIPKVSRAAAWGLVALYIAVFPANINMAVNQLPLGDTYYPIGNWVRLPFQILFIVWAYYLSKRRAWE